MLCSFYWAQRTMWYDQLWDSKLTPIGEKSGGKIHIYSVWRGQIYDKNYSELFAWAIHLKPQNLSYHTLNLVGCSVLVVFVCLCGCVIMFESVLVCVCACYCMCMWLWLYEMTDPSKHMTKTIHVRTIHLKHHNLSY